MRLLPRLTAGFAAILGVLGVAGPAPAAWDNVFQVCCNSCGKAPQTSYYAAPCPQPCPQPQVQVNYIQRTYYQSVTEYQRRSYYQPVTTNYTSYYYEPVTTYRYSTYYDPCTGCPQKVCTPCTSYQLRSKCNAVTSYVERCAMVPVTSLRPVTVRQPVVSYYYPPQPVCPPANSAAPAAPATIPPAGPSVEQLRENPPSVVPSNPGGETISPPNPPLPGASYPRTSPSGSPKIRPEKTVSRSSLITVRGEVVMPDQLTPRSGARLVFMNASNQGEKKYATANQFGEFDIQLPAGHWYVYLGGADGKAVYHKQVNLGDRDTYDYKVVSR